MKTSLVILSCSLLSAAALAAGPASGRGDRPCAQVQNSTAPVVLNAAAREAVLFQIEEERMARELYVALGEKWGARQFRRIPQAERRHEDMLRALAARADLAVPAAVPAKFASSVIQQRYDTLLARGLVSETEALAVGAVVERQDIADLQALRPQVAGTDLAPLVDALEAASERHLAAFTGERGGGAQRGRRGRS